IRSWSAAILQKGRVLACQGPYSACRHPLYAGSLLMVLGFCLLLGDPWTTLILAAVLLITYPATVRNEERMISSAFSADWPAYAAATPRLFPPRLPTGVGPVSLSQWIHNREYQAIFASVVAVAGIQIWRMVASR
ncbi:MAG TPA: isoprenylcysteine carboxylmethyltransferase family protein, partial [Pirellulaceae bacterium]|nr:isoprenylcysteine carboxylmethyltransferase family protein [Pirellulaceae bacterium]